MTDPKVIRYAKWTAAVVVALTATLAFVYDWGWVPRKTYIQDHVEEATAETLLRAVEQVQSQQMAAQVTLSEFRITWDCDEMFEEIPDLMDEAKEAEGTPEESEKRFKLKNKQDRYEELNCKNYISD